MPLCTSGIVNNNLNFSVTKREYDFLLTFEIICTDRNHSSLVIFQTKRQKCCYFYSSVSIFLLRFITRLSTSFAVLFPILVIANQEKAIVDSIFANYDKRVRPICDTNDMTQLNVTIDYFHLIEIVSNTVFNIKI